MGLFSFELVSSHSSFTQGEMVCVNWFSTTLGTIILRSLSHFFHSIDFALNRFISNGMYCTDQNLNNKTRIHTYTNMVFKTTKLFSKNGEKWKSKHDLGRFARKYRHNSNKFKRKIEKSPMPNIFIIFKLNLKTKNPNARNTNTKLIQLNPNKNKNKKRKKKQKNKFQTI